MQGDGTSDSSLSEEELFIPVSDEYILHGLLRRNFNSKRVAILCHGIFSNKRHPLLKELSQKLPINSIRFDFHGNGQSGGDKKWSFGGYMDEASKDIRTVVKYARETLFLDVVMLVGHSRAATSVILYAAAFDDIPLLASISGRYHLDEGLSKYFPTNYNESSSLLKEGEKFTNEESHAAMEESVPEEGYEFVSADGQKRVITREAVKERLKLSKCIDCYLQKIDSSKNIRKVIFAHGTSDRIVPIEDMNSMAKIISDKKKVVCAIKDGDHSLRSTDNGKSPFVDTLISCLEYHTKESTFDI